jgi:hypothetical protein
MRTLAITTSAAPRTDFTRKLFHIFYAPISRFLITEVSIRGEGPCRYLLVLDKIRLRFETETQVHHRMGKLTPRDVHGLLGPTD